MGKIPYVLEYKLFEQTEIKNAEEILAEYNDFYIYNFAQYQNLYDRVDERFIETSNGDISEEKQQEIAEHNARVATDHFKKLFGHPDFAESCMVGFRPAWYDLQQILLEEFKYKTPILESAMNDIAPKLRAAATVSLFSERLIHGLQKVNADAKVVNTMKDGFKLLFERLQTENINLPDFHTSKKAISKFKKAEQYIEYCEKLFFAK